MKKITLSALLTTLISFTSFAQAPYFTFDGGADVNLVSPSRGAGGRAIVHGAGNALILNFDDDFTGGTYLGRYFSLFHDGSLRVAPNGNQEAFNLMGNGYLGLGTSQPGSKLHIPGDEFITMGNYEASNGVRGISFTGFRDNVANYFGASIEAVPEWTCCGGYPGAGYAGIKNIGLSFMVHNDIGIGNSKLAAMSIKSNGDIGIGTLSPREKLSVNGNIRAKEVKVESTNWPDYVFEEGYKFETLEGLDSYIKANKHLPGIPSAKEVSVNGIELGEMNKKLLEKIEELTLHLIEKDKQLNNQSVKVTDIETKLAQQDKMLNEILKKLK